MDFLSYLQSLGGQPSTTSVGYTGGGGYSPAGDVGAGMSGITGQSYAPMQQAGGGFLGGLFGGPQSNYTAGGGMADLLGTLLRKAVEGRTGLSFNGLGGGQQGFGAPQSSWEPWIKYLNQAPYTPAQGSHALSLGGLVTSMCCHPETLIHTPEGLVPIRFLRPGDHVWSRNAAGDDVIERVKRTSRFYVGPGHVFANVAGSWITPVHPFPDGTPVGEQHPERAADLAGATHDIAVTGETGLYYVGHARIAMGSTLDRRHRRAA